MNLDVSFRHRFGDFALEIAFTVQRTGVTALFGPSGAGKTTVLNAIAGLLNPDEGRIAIGERVLFDSKAGIWLPPRQRGIGYVFQDARLFPHLDVERNLRFGWRRAYKRLPESEVARILKLLGLTSLLRRRPGNLSGGEKARVALGRALLAAPDILLLDEPLAALDLGRKAEILPYLERVRDQATLPILYVSHSLDEVSRLAQEMIVIKDGRVALSGAASDVLTDLRLPDYTGGSPYGAMIETEVSRHASDEGLTRLAFPGGELLVPLLSEAEGTRLRTRIRAEDVMIALEKPNAISANNLLPVTISQLRESTPAHVDVRLLCGPTPIVARITRSSCARLRLHPGQRAFAVVKSVTLAPQTG
ncbi:MAG: molybdenum ABC transporter ATP-binding protein [Alphaproteobacteria bacterium]|nr:molybdenum ABC transporter ATP-binding protein [Alphaproteobacteria bacterium]MBV9063214.1 molybdenum ABC transporter ATP-binding protein [Alphaproteobacteria bacterium]